MYKHIALVGLLCLAGCGAGADRDLSREEDDRIRALRVAAREADVRQWTARMEVDTTRRRAVVEDDILLLEERMTGLRLAWEALRLAETDDRPRREAEFDQAMGDLQTALADVRRRSP